jgi:hypothetical protein
VGIEGGRSKFFVALSTAEVIFGVLHPGGLSLSPYMV